jgi:hypothetical protein
MDLLTHIDALSEEQLFSLSKRGDATGVLAEYRLAALTNSPAPDRETIVVGDGYAIVAANGELKRVELDGVAKMIVEEDGGYCVYSADGSEAFGCYRTMVEAQDRLQQVHYLGQPDVTKESYTPPQGVQEAGQQAFDWIEEGHAGDGFTDVGRARASQLARGDNVSRETIGRMASFLARHEGDSEAEGWNLGEDGFPSPGRVAWEAWGGDAGKTWADSIMDREKVGDSCPIATSDVATNLKNRQVAIDVADYGPLNPNEPNDAFWGHLSTYFDVTPDEARTTVCGNCAAFDQTSHMDTCIAEGMSGDTEDPFDVVDAGDLGYCRIFKFKCASARTCSAWIAGGPIVDKPDTTELAKARFVRKAEERQFTLGPLYVPDFMDAHGEWTDPDTLQNAVWGWVNSGDRRIFLQHDRDVEAGSWVEVMTMPQPWTVQMLDSNGANAGEVTYPAGTVFLGVVWNDESWVKIKRGELRGYSIGGMAGSVYAEMPDGAVREGVEVPG